MEISDWIELNSIEIDEQVGEFYLIGDYSYKYLHEQELKTKDKQFELTLSKEDISDIRQGAVDFFIYEFGGKYYYTPSSNVIDLKLTPFLINSYKPFVETAFLGVHGRYEVMNGTRSYSDWASRGKELGYNALAIVEQHTLAGTLSFQLACKKAEIKPIIGMSVMVEAPMSRYNVNLYCRSDKAWRALLKINRWINVDNDGLIGEEDFIMILHESDLIIAVDPHNGFNEKKAIRLSNYCKVYYKISTNEYYSKSKELEVLGNMNIYMNKFCLLYTSPSPRDATLSRMPSSA